MSALAEALVAAQRRAISALEKGYVAGRIERDTAIAALDGIGCTDAVDQTRLLLALDTIREWGAQLPAEAKPAANGDAEPANAVPLEESDLRKHAARPDLGADRVAESGHLRRERLGRAVLVCACDLEPCPACAEREAAEWDTDPRDDFEQAREAFSGGRSMYDPEAAR